MRKTPLLVAVALLLLLGLGFIASFTTTTAGARQGRTFQGQPPTATDTAATARANETPPPATLDSPGAPAIAPSTPSDDPGMPSFTEADVRAFVATFSHPDVTPGSAPPTIAAIDFRPAGHLDARFGSPNLSPDRLVCVVTLRGSFTIYGPGGRFKKTGTVGYYIFDAKTGNELQESVGELQ